MKIQLIFSFSVILIFLNGCSLIKTPGLQSNFEYPVISYLEMRDKWITYLAGPEGTLYHVQTKDGKILANSLNEMQMRANHPNLYFELNHMMADVINEPSPNNYEIRVKKIEWENQMIDQMRSIKNK